MLKESDVVLVMEEGQKEAIQNEFPFAQNKVHLLSEVVEGVAYDVPDPAGAGEEFACNHSRSRSDDARGVRENI